VLDLHTADDSLASGADHDDERNSQLPDCWTNEQWQYFKSQNSWLFLRHGRLGCSACKSVGGLGVNKVLTGMKTQLSHEWCNALITSYGSDKPAQKHHCAKKILTIRHQLVTKKHKKS